MNRWHRHEALQGQLRPRELLPHSEEEARRFWAQRRAHRTVRDEERRRRGVGLVLTAAVAGLAHIAVLMPLFAFWIGQTREIERTDVRVVTLGQRSWDANRQLRAPDAPPPAVEEDKDKNKDDPDEPPPGQLVSLPRSNDEAPAQADYLAQDDHRAERETRSRYQTQHYKNQTHKPQVGRDEPAEMQPSDTEPSEPSALVVGPPSGPKGEGIALDGDAGKDQESGGGAPRLAFEIPRQPAREALELEGSKGDILNRRRQEAIESGSDRLDIAMGRRLEESAQRGDGVGPASGESSRGGTGGERLPTLAELTPSRSELERITGMPANDALHEVETDVETRLNAWRWKHAVFFDRLKKGVNRHWRGVEVYQRNDPSRQVYARQNLLTWLAVTIDREGNIVQIGVVEHSGAAFLDDEAVRTMRAAAPFTNPPGALFGRQDTFTFRFGFEIRNEFREIDLNWRPY
jgi:TonB family protein